MQHEVASAREGIEVRLVVRMSREAGWRAWVLGPDANRREFVSPFELARFLAWPASQASASPNVGIR